MVDQLLIVDDDRLFAQLLGRAMRQRQFATFIAHGQDGASAILSRQKITHAIVDLRIGRENGVDLVALLKRANPTVRAIVLTGYGSVRTAVAAVRAGASEFITKPADADEIEAFLRPNGYDWTKFPPHKRNIDDVRIEHIVELYEFNDRNLSETAWQLSMHRRTLQRILRRFELYDGIEHLRAPSNFGHLRRLHAIWSRIINH